MKKTITLLILITSIFVGAKELQKRYSFTEVHTISGRTVFSWDKKITHTDTIKHVNCPVLKYDTVYIDKNGWKHEIKIENIVIKYK